MDELTLIYYLSYNYKTGVYGYLNLVIFFEKAK